MAAALSISFAECTNTVLGNFTYPGCDLQEITFRKSQLTGVHFVRCKGRKLHLHNVVLNRVCFVDVDFDNVGMINLRLSGVKFGPMAMINVLLTQSSFEPSESRKMKVYTITNSHVHWKRVADRSTIARTANAEKEYDWTVEIAPKILPFGFPKPLLLRQDPAIHKRIMSFLYHQEPLVIYWDSQGLRNSLVWESFRLPKTLASLQAFCP